MFPAGLKPLERDVPDDAQRILAKIEEAERIEELNKAEARMKFKPTNLDIFPSSKTIMFDRQDLAEHFNVKAKSSNQTEKPVVKKYNITPYDRNKMSITEFTTRFDIPVEGVTKQDGSDRVLNILLAILHMFALSAGLTLLCLSWFDVAAWIAVVIGVVLAVGLYAGVFAVTKQGKQWVANAVILSMSVIFILAIAAVVQKCGILIFNRCSYFVALLIVLLTGFLFGFVRSVYKESRR